MLIQFSVTNFRSIKDKVTLSMLAGNVKEHPEHLISYANEKYLKSAVIYGANASGKSNIIRAFSFMVDFVLNSHNLQLHKKIPRYPFQFDKDTQYFPSKFEVIFISNGISYAYGFSINDDEVIDEYLKENGLKLPENEMDYFRVIYESMVKKYSEVKTALEEISGKKYKKVHMIGGGAKSSLLCKLIAKI